MIIIMKMKTDFDKIDIQTTVFSLLSIIVSQITIDNLRVAESRAVNIRTIYLSTSKGSTEIAYNIFSHFSHIGYL